MNVLLTVTLCHTTQHGVVLIIFALNHDGLRGGKNRPTLSPDLMS